MKFSELWIREWVDIPFETEVLSNQITMAGFKVENIKPVSMSFNGVLIGEIINYSKHPSSNVLNVIKVSIGDQKTLKVVYHTLNYFQGMKVIVATINSILPDNLKIKMEKLCGVLYEGILCSLSELGISYNQNEINELPFDAPIGTDIREYLKLNDNVIEINVTPNRTDCLSILGIARDLSILNQTKLNIPEIIPVVDSTSDTFPIHIEAIKACPRYLGRVIKNINIGVLTPIWIKEKLRRCGIHSINPIIDITNFILLELGQPVYIFDKDYITDGIIIRMAKKGEKFVFSDGNEIQLDSNTLVIADHVKILTIGGLFSKQHSGIHDNTKNILLGCPLFHPLFINRLHRQNLDNDFIYHYEHNTDTTLQYKAIERITRLLLNICGGEAGPVIDITNAITLPKRNVITLRRNNIDRLVGYHINDIQINNILHRLECKIIKNEDKWKIIIPIWRFDIKIEEDIIEEIVRIHGYNNIPNKKVLSFLKRNSFYEPDLLLKRIKNMLNDKGYHEVITYSFVDPKIQRMIHPKNTGLILLNPISKEMSVMRLSLWTGLLSTIIYNQNRQQKRIRIFETGLRFVPDIQANLGIKQDLMLAGAIFGNLYEEHWDMQKNIVDFYDIKGDVEMILDLTGQLSKVQFRKKIIPALHPGKSAALYLHKECIGFIGVLHPKIERKLNLNGRVIMFELEWKKISDYIVPRIQDVSRFPENRRDIAIVIAEEIPAASVLAECKKIFSNQIVNVNLFDVYQGKGIEKGHKSLAISLIFQDTHRTLKEEEITNAVLKCVERLKKQFQASLRIDYVFKNCKESK